MKKRIRFIGFLVHAGAVRFRWRSDRFLLPAGALLGGIILITADIFARSMVAPAELQIGILTSLLGGPFFLALLLRARRQGASNVGL